MRWLPAAAEVAGLPACSAFVEAAGFPLPLAILPTLDRGATWSDGGVFATTAARTAWFRHLRQTSAVDDAGRRPSPFLVAFGYDRSRTTRAGRRAVVFPWVSLSLETMPAASSAAVDVLRLIFPPVR